MDVLSTFSSKKNNVNSKKLIESLNSIIFLVESKKDEFDLDEIFRIIGHELLKEDISFMVSILDSKKSNLKVRHFSSYPAVIKKVTAVIDGISTARTFSVKFLDSDCYNHTLSTKEVKFCKNRIRKIEKKHKPIRAFVKNYNDVNSITAPLIVKGEIIGFLEYFSPLLSETHQKVFEHFSKSILRNITNTLLFQEVKKTEERYKDIFEYSKEGFYILNGRKKKFVDVNRAMSSITGYTKDELLQMNYVLIFEEGERKKIDSYVKERMLGKNSKESAPRSYETKVKTKKGNIKNTTIEISRIINQDEWFVIMQDITSKKEFENKLKKSEEKYRKLVDNATDMVVVVNEEGLLIFENDAFLKTSGYSKNEVVDESFFRFVHPEDLKLVQENFKKITNKKETVRTYEFRMLTKDKEEKIVSISGDTIEDKGEVVGVQAILRDITEDRLLQQKIEKAKHHYEAVIDTINDSLFVIDSSFKIISFNKSFIEKTEMTAGNIKNKHCFEVLKNFNGGLFSQICNCEKVHKRHCDIAQAFQSKKAISIEKITTKNNKTSYFELTILPSINKEGRVYQSVVLISDITKDKESEAEIRRLHEFTNRILDNVPLSIAVVDKDCCIISLNAYGRKLLEDEMIGKCLTETKEIKSNKQLVKYYNDLLMKGKSFYYNNLPYVNSKKGEQRYLNIIAVPLVDQNNNIEGAISMGLDNTEAVFAKVKLEDLNRDLELKVLKRTQELNEINKKLQSAIDLKSKFISDASHELRTPMTIIKGNIDLALRENQLNGGETPELFEIINHEIGQISGILSDLTMLTNVDSMAETLLHEKVEVDKILKESAKSLEVLASEKNIKLEAILNTNFMLYGDEAKLEKVLLNIIRNAIKYTDKDGIIKVFAKSDDDHIVICVKDNGIGIPAKELPYIFERFYRVDKARTRAEGGTGLGLSICKWIIEAHNGYIKVESQEHEGSTFCIHLPRDYKKENLNRSLF